MRYSPAELEQEKSRLALARSTVETEWRDFQIGTQIVRLLIAAARSRGFLSIFVLGDLDFYQRFGFRSEVADCVDCEQQGKRFLALELVPNSLAGYKGKLEYPTPLIERSSPSPR
ncbi:MAG: hypothetical protein U5K75_07040 [Ahrensia sp.]|nr:hypothetical protein [Ahrensia sp.]